MNTNTASAAMWTLAGKERAPTADSPRPEGVGWLTRVGGVGRAGKRPHSASGGVPRWQGGVRGNRFLDVSVFPFGDFLIWEIFSPFMTFAQFCLRAQTLSASDSPCQRAYGGPTTSRAQINLGKRPHLPSWGQPGHVEASRGPCRPGAVQCRQRVLVTVNFTYFALYP